MAALFDGLLRRLDRILRSVLVYGHVDLRTDHLQLLDGGGTVNVARGQQRLFALLLQIVGQLSGHGGLTGALQAAQHINRRHGRRPRQPGMLGTHQGRHFLADDLHHLLGGGQAVQHLLAHAAFRDLLAEILDHQVVDVGFQKRHAHVAHALLDGLLRQLAPAGQLGERAG